jgi:hypothetical protein
MKVAIMQPYFMPYIGYFQMIAAVDTFVIYDNIEYTKKGWINRNRILKNGEPDTISLPLAKGSDFETVVNRHLAASFHDKDKKKLLQKIKELYRKAPYFNETLPLLDVVFNAQDSNLFDFIHHSVKAVCSHLDIPTTFVVSSSVDIDHQLKAQDKVLAICQALGASQYINAIGGVELYDTTSFRDKNIHLQFIKTTFPSYQQFNHAFVPWLSIIDVLMFCGKEYTQNNLSAYTLVESPLHSEGSVD